MASLGRGHIGVKKIVALSCEVAVQAQAWVTRNIPILSPTADTTKIFRQPLVTPIPQRVPPPQLTFAVNLLLTTLAVAAPVAAPFTPANATQLDPVRATVSRQYDTPTNLLTNTLAPVVVPDAPFYQTDWPNPLTPRPATAGFSAHRDLLALISPFVQSEWPNPSRGLSVQQPDSLPSLLTTTLEVVVAGDKPFLLDDWPLPTRPLLAREYGFVQAQVFNTADVVNDKPFLQTDWPLPLLRVGQVVPLHHRYAGEPVAAPGIPFAQTEWPNPVLAIPPTDGFAAHRDLDALAVIPPPPEFPTARQLDWPNPRINPQYKQLPLMGRVLGEEPFPFAQTQWDNPLPKPLARQGLVASQIFNTANIVYPFFQTEWPNPVLAVRTREFGFVQPQVFNTADVVVPIPFTETEWPNPVLPIKAREYGFVQAQIFNTADVVNPEPFHQDDWTNPVLAVARREFGATAPLLYDRFVFVEPFPDARLLDWPNPVLPIARREFGSTSPLNYDRFVLPEVMPAARQLDWPNPVLLIAQREFGSVQAQVFNTEDGVAIIHLRPIAPIMSARRRNHRRR